MYTTIVLNVKQPFVSAFSLHFCFLFFLFYWVSAGLSFTHFSTKHTNLHYIIIENTSCLCACGCKFSTAGQQTVPTVQFGLSIFLRGTSKPLLKMLIVKREVSLSSSFPAARTLPTGTDNLCW